MELSGHTVDDLLRTAEQRLSQTSSEHGRQTDLVDGAPKPEKSTAGDENKRPAAAARLETRIVSAKSTHKTESDDAGPGWFGLPRTQLTPALRRDFQVLRLRGALDPKVHYKKSASKSQFPRYSHVGEVVEGPTEFNSARLTKRERKSTFAEEVLSARGLKDRSKMKYSGIQERKTSGKKAYYKATRRQPRT